MTSGSEIRHMVTASRGRRQTISTPAAGHDSAITKDTPETSITSINSKEVTKCGRNLRLSSSDAPALPESVITGRSRVVG
jgi:hypothetical protein